MLQSSIIYFQFATSKGNWIYCQEIYMQPSDVYTNLLQSVTFTCKISGYSPKSDLVEWCKNSFCTWGTRNDTTDGRLQYKSLQRYYIVGDRNNGTLFIYNTFYSRKMKSMLTK